MSFSVTAGGTPLPTYQWYKNNLANPISSAANPTATNATLVIGSTGVLGHRKLFCGRTERGNGAHHEQQRAADGQFADGLHLAGAREWRDGTLL